ncbi:MAG: hypothetical protein AAFV90_09305 [Cyanobacteria bacterium J06634_5]
MNAAQRPITPSTQSTPETPSKKGQSSGESSPLRKAYRIKRVPHAGARQAIAFESSVKLTVNLLLAIVATTTIAKLVPYYQSQQERLSTLQESVQVAERKNSKLRSQFDRNFDPAQASRIMQEQSGRAYPNQKKVIWTSPLDTE